MAPNPFFSGRIPKDLHSRIEKHLEETGQSKTQLLVNALSSYLDYPIQLNISSGNLAEDRFSSLEKRVEALERSLSEIQSTRIDNQNTSDNKLDNIFDNKEFEEQLSPIKSNNKSDNEFDNQASQAIQASEATETVFSENNYEYLGKYHAPEILEFLEFREFNSHDKTKIKNKLRNANTTKHKTTSIPPYFFKIIGKEEGNKGQLIYDVHRLKA